MIKGWRNDPRWVEIMERRKSERIARALERIRIKNEISKLPAMIRPGQSGQPEWCKKPYSIDCGY